MMLYSLKETVTMKSLASTHSCPNNSFSLLDKSYMFQEKPCLFCGCGLGTDATLTKGECTLFLIARKQREGRMPLVKGLGAVQGPRQLPEWHAAWPVQVYGLFMKRCGAPAATQFPANCRCGEGLTKNTENMGLMSPSRD